ncbi:MAG: glycosyltransferase [Myxococcales bacterium]|nr:glycosyltransferase [Myxococcales bacterium]MCB9704940.1 glycosyltransferase [Myxococcales bacterium]
MTRILLVGSYQAPSGLARVTRGIARSLEGAADVHVLGLDRRHVDVSPPEAAGGHVVHANPDPLDLFGEGPLPRLCRRLRPDLLLVVQDPWFAARIAAATVGMPKLTRVGYMPVDGRLLRPELIDGLAVFDAVVAPTEYGRRQLLDATARASAAPAWTASTSVIPHGVDVASFAALAGAPAERRRRARVEILGDAGDDPDALWILNANRHQTRKRLDLTLQGFARFAAGRPPGVKLVLHWGDEPGPWRLRAMSRALRIEERVIVTGVRGGLPDGALNRIYNACEIGLNTALGEGWGLPAFEHGATGAALVLPDNSVHRELWSGAASLLPVERHAAPGAVIEGAVCSVDGVAAALAELADDPQRRELAGAAASARALHPSLSWMSVGARWREVAAAALARAA